MRYKPMQSQIQSLNIKRPAEQTSRAVVSAILIDQPAVAAAAAAIPFSCFVPTISTNCSVSTVLDLYRYQIYLTAKSAKSTRLTDLFRSAISTTIPTDRRRLTILLLLFNRSVPLFQLFYYCYFGRLLPTSCC